MRPSHRLLLGVLVALALVPAALRAQQVTGAVRDSAAGIPIPGVVVIVLDSAGRAGARTITDASGSFTVFAPLSAARLRLMRIGYRLREVPIGARTGPVRLAMERIPPMLERVRVSDSELCPGSSDRGAAFQLWEQARAGLLATVVARELKPARARTLVYESVISPTDEMIRRQTKHVQSGRTTRPFISAAMPSHYARYGYLMEDRGERVFNAPDADVLLDESFATTHCFRLTAADSAHASQTGLAFAPAPGRDTLVDVSGVIWIDNTSPQLRSLDFRYTALEPVSMAMRAGGHIEFRTMSNGVAFIERWNLRLPGLQTATTPVGGSPTSRGPIVVPRWDRRDVRVSEIIEAGGIVLEARWDDGAEWTDTPAAITGVVTRRKTNGPVADAVITLVGTVDTTATDNAGEFEIQVVPGRYMVSIADTTLQLFDAPRTERQPVLATRAQVSPIHVELAPIGETIANLCRGQAVGDSAVLLTGFVSMADVSPINGTSLVADWQEAGPLAQTRQQRMDVDDKGRFLVCGVARDRPVHLALFKKSNRLGDTTVAVMSVQLTQPVVWRVAPLVVSAESATIEGSVLDDASKQPLSGAEVAIPSLQRAATTGEDGTFRLAGIPAGTHAVHVRHVGNEPVNESIKLEPRARLTRSFSLRRATVLDTVRTRASAVTANLRVFETHRATRMGSYVTDSALRLRSGQRLADVLVLTIQDLRVVRTGQGVYVVAPSRGRVLSGFRNASRCVSTVYLDGELRWDARETIQRPFSIGEYWADDMAAVEFYAANAPVPPEYRRVQSECGTLVLWTRDRNKP